MLQTDVKMESLSDRVSKASRELLISLLSYYYFICKSYLSLMSLTITETRTAFGRSKSWIVGSKPFRGRGACSGNSGVFCTEEWVDFRP